MNRSLFTRIVRDLSANCPYFQEGCDAVGKAGISALVKCTFAIRLLSIADCVRCSSTNIYQIGGTNFCDWLMHFCTGDSSIMARTSTVQNGRGLNVHKHIVACSVSVIAGSEPFILLEAVASQDLWIWHAFFGVAGSNNDVNVLRQSPVLNDLKVGKAPENGLELMEVDFAAGSNDVKRIRYKASAEAARKDVERDLAC
ncbi:ALP1-like protein isoform X1 [Tanacetum coccineum]